jgi:tryptophan 2,3-dioxygenase
VDVINRNIDASSQFYADLNRNADEASKLIDALPSSYSDLRKERDKTVDSVQSIRKELAALIAKKSDVPTRYLETQLFAEKIVNLDISVIKWGDKAMRAADETIEQQDAKVKALNRAVNVLVPLAAVFGLIAAFSGVKVEGSD